MHNAAFLQIFLQNRIATSRNFPMIPNTVYKSSKTSEICPEIWMKK